MYEKRRDWEKLLGLERREAERLDPGPERAAKFLEIAKLATERVKKPEICIVLWQEVIDSDPKNVEALGALAGLYERNKEFEKLATVLEQQAELTYDAASKVVILSKLGTIYGDRLNNDEGAVTAWRALLALDPNDRKAQEAVKKKYLALGRWDDLEVFYAESGKWDEFIRVLEQQEAKETDAASEDRSPLQDRPAVGRQEAEGRSRCEGLREGPRARSRTICKRPRRSSRSTRRRTTRRRSRGSSRSSSRHEEDPQSQASLSCARLPRSTKGACASRRRLSTGTWLRSRSPPGTNRRGPTWSALRRGRASGNA